VRLWRRSGAEAAADWPRLDRKGRAAIADLMDPSFRWRIEQCPGRPIDGDVNTCTHAHESGVLYRHGGS
jgi:hypothetical protein